MSIAKGENPKLDPECAQRISVMRGESMVPLVDSAKGRYTCEQPWRGVLLERHLVRPDEIPEHEHPHLCLHLQVTGSHSFEWWSSGKNAVEHADPGSLILIPPGTRDRLRWLGFSERIILSVDRSTLAELASDMGGRPPEFKGSWSLNDPLLRRLLTEMGNEARRGWPFGSLYADLLAMEVKTSLLRNHVTEPVKAPIVKGGLTLPRLRHALEFINANLAEDVRINAIARELDLSSCHFAHAFRNQTGQTPHQYLLRQRITKAKDLLRRTNWPVQYISGLAGFRSPVNFVRTFRQLVGQTPEVWRKNL